METDIVYRLAVKEDRVSILQFLREHFYPDEPLNYALYPKEQDAFDEASIMQPVASENGICLLALKGKTIIGVGISGPKGPDEEQKLLEEASHIPGTKFSKILLILAAIERDSNVCRKFNFNKVMYGYCLAVHKNFRGSEIARKITEKTLQMAKVMEYPMYTADCTSSYSARLCESVGMECINVCNMEEYREPNSDAQVMFPMGEHKYVKTYVKSML